MADEQTQEEIEAREKLIELMVEQARTGQKGIDATISLYLEKTKLGKAMVLGTKATKDLTSGFKNSAKALGTSTGSFGDLTGAVTGTIGAITGLLGAIPVVGKAFKFLGDAAAETAEFAIGQVQANYNSFKELAKAGTIGADGVMGMANQFKEAGLPLQTYTKLLTKNSEALAYFSGSALKGGKDFSKLIGNMDEKTKTYMRNLGYGVDEIAESAIEWQVLQRQRGIRQQLTDMELTKGTAAYVSELDALAKLTGQNVDALKKQRDEVRSDSRFRAQLMRLNASGNHKGANAMELFAATMMKAAPEIGQGFRDITSGAINTEAAQKLARSGILDTARAVQKGLQSGQIDASEGMRMMRDAAQESSKVGGAMHGLAGFIENGSGPFLDLAKTATFGNMAIERMTELVNIQNKVREKPDPTTDRLSKTMAKLEQSIATVNQFFIATPAATATIAAFSTALKESVDFISEYFLKADKKGKTSSNYVGQKEEFNRPSYAARKRVELTGTADEKAAMAKRIAAASKEATRIASLPKYKNRQTFVSKLLYGDRSNIAKDNETLNPTASLEVAAPKEKKVAATRTFKKVTDEDYAAAKKTFNDYNASAQEGGWTAEETRRSNELAAIMKGVKRELEILNENTSRATQDANSNANRSRNNSGN